MLKTLSPNDVALVLRRTGWILMESRIVVELVVLDRCQSHVSGFSPFNNSKLTRIILNLKLCALNGMGDIRSWRGSSDPRTTHPGGQLVLGPCVWGDIWSGGTVGPPTPVSNRFALKPVWPNHIVMWFTESGFQSTLGAFTQLS